MPGLMHVRSIGPSSASWGPAAHVGARAVSNRPSPQCRQASPTVSQMDANHSGPTGHRSKCSEVAVVLTRTSDSTRSGRVAASSAAAKPPSEYPMTTARSDPTASSTATMSSARCSTVGVAGIGSDSPVPGLSNRITRAKRLSRSSISVASGSLHHSSRCDIVPHTNTTSRGPSPITS